MKIFSTFLLALLFSAVNSQETITTANSCNGISVDGNGDDWDSCSSEEITLDLKQIGQPGNDVITNGLRVRFAYDDANIFVLARITGRYFFNLTAGNPFSHSVSVMWKIGDNATMYNMGGCAIPVQDSNNCTQVRTACDNGMCSCTSHLVDIWHMETASPGAIPGVQYPLRDPIVFQSGGNYKSYAYNPESEGVYQPVVEHIVSGNDHTSNTDDEFSVHPCLRSDDGSSSSYVSEFINVGTRYSNQIRYAWSHTAIDSYQYPFGINGADGSYIYEWSRPLSTSENTDVLFSKESPAYFAFGFWVPSEVGVGWEDADHFVAPPSYEFGTLTFSSGYVTISSSLLVIAAVICVVIFLL